MRHPLAARDLEAVERAVEVRPHQQRRHAAGLERRIERGHRLAARAGGVQVGMYCVAT